METMPICIWLQSSIPRKLQIKFALAGLLTCLRFEQPSHAFERNGIVFDCQNV
jgi:hypothetical protein